jgi:hypothetical protein
MARDDQNRPAPGRFYRADAFLVVTQPAAAAAKKLPAAPGFRAWLRAGPPREGAVGRVVGDLCLGLAGLVWTP